MASLKDKVQLQFQRSTDSIYNMKNFEKLCRAVNNMDHELCNFRDDIVDYFKKGFDNLPMKTEIFAVVFYLNM